MYRSSYQIDIGNIFYAAKNRYEQEGYIVKENIYNAASFGVPQERFRSVVIGMKKRIYITGRIFGT